MDTAIQNRTFEDEQGNRVTGGGVWERFVAGHLEMKERGEGGTPLAIGPQDSDNRYVLVDDSDSRRRDISSPMGVGRRETRIPAAHSSTKSPVGGRTMGRVTPSTARWWMVRLKSLSATTTATRWSLSCRVAAVSSPMTATPTETLEMTTPVTTTRTVILPPDELDERITRVRNEINLSAGFKAEDGELTGADMTDGHVFVVEESGRRLDTIGQKYALGRSLVDGEAEIVEEDEDGNPVVIEDESKRMVREDRYADRSAGGDGEDGDDDAADSSGFDDD